MVPFAFGIARTAAAACAAAAALTSFGFMDANPSLYCYHQLLQTKSSFQDHVYGSQFANKTVWIVGASSGIGEQLAYQIAPYCEKLILSARNVQKLQRVANNCHQKPQQQHPSKVVILPMDITLPPDELEQTILQQLAPELPSTTADNADTHHHNKPSLDCVIFNAGQGHLSTVLETDAATTINMFAVNTIPPMVLTQILMKHGILAPPLSQPPVVATQQQKRPQIVITSSVGGRMGVPLSSSYAASKHALHGYAASLQAECSSWLRVDLICPGSTETKFFQNQRSTTATIPSEGGVRSGIDDEKGQHQQQQLPEPSPMKMPVERCAALAMTHICRNSNPNANESGGEAWIAQQPTLIGCYLQQFLPGLWKFALNKSIGPKRVSLYNKGMDLYDPASWTGKKTE